MNSQAQDRCFLTSNVSLLRCSIEYFTTGDPGPVTQDLLTNPNIADSHEALRSLVIEFLRFRDWSSAEWVLKQGITLNPSDPCDFGPIHEAIENCGDCPDIISWLLDHGATADRRGQNNWTPLHFAASFGNTGTLKLLLDRGVQIDVGTEVDGNLTPLMEAAISGRSLAIIVLASRGADLQRRDTLSNRTAAELAGQYGHKHAATLLGMLENMTGS